MPNNPTRKDSLPVHAARLRAIAEPLRKRAQDYASASAASDNAGSVGIARLEAAAGAQAAMDAAALLAGAEAVEAVEVAKAALRVSKAELWGAFMRAQKRNDEYLAEKMSAAFEQATAALARLEGK